MSPKAERKLKSHAAILASASMLLRERGIKASSVMDVMKGAGLTVGGFMGISTRKNSCSPRPSRPAPPRYGTASSRRPKARPRASARGVIHRYLSRSHRDNADVGCLLPSVAPEIAREGEPYRSALEIELAGFVNSFGAMLGPTPEHREKALGLIALMFGALSMARAINGTPLSDECLRAAKKLAERIVADEEG